MTHVHKNPSDGSIDTAKLADDAVTTAKLADNSVTNSKMADNAVDTAEIVDDAVTPAKIDSSQVFEVGGAHVVGSNAAGGLFTEDGTGDTLFWLGKTGVTALDYIAGWSVRRDDSDSDELDIRYDNVTRATMDTLGNINGTSASFTGSVTAGNLGTLAELSAVDTTQLVNDAVTNSKIAANAVDTTQLVDDAVTTGKIAANAVTNSKIAANAVDTTQLVNDAVTNSKIAANAVDTAQLVDDAVTPDKISRESVSAAISGGTTGGSGSSTVTTNLNGNIHRFRVSLADDGFVALTLDFGMFQGGVYLVANTAARGGVLYHIRTASAGRFVTEMASATTNIFNNSGDTALTGTTGPDGYINVAVQENTLYIENRAGGGIGIAGNLLTG